MISRLFVLCLLAPCCNAWEIWLSPSGSDDAAGTPEAPLASPEIALRRAREARRLNQVPSGEGVTIHFAAGVYPLRDTLRLRPEDSGTAQFPLILQGPAKGAAVLSGGVPLGPWQPAADVPSGIAPESTANLWVAKVGSYHGQPLSPRQLWVQDTRTTRARHPNAPDLVRLSEWNKTRRVATFAAQPFPMPMPAGVEMTLSQMWEIAQLRIASAERVADRWEVKFAEPEATVQFERPWPQPITTPGNESPFFLSGAPAFLDQPGEWVFESAQQRILYRPRAGETPATANAIVPALETLVEIAGTPERPVRHVELRGLTFSHAAWKRPAEAGHVPLQAAMPMIEGYKLSPKGTPEWRSLDNQGWIARAPAAVTVRGASALTFRDCTFSACAGSGLDLVSAVSQALIEGNRFTDLGLNGLQLGNFQEGPEETHLPYDPSDERLVVSEVRIRNNVITDCGVEDWGAVGLGVGFAREISIEHNELAYLPYTGISLGWGWTRELSAARDHRVERNLIHHVAQRMADAAGIYTLSAQPGTIIRENYIHSITMSPWVHDPQHWFYLYLDEGTAHVVMEDNACPEEKFLFNANGPGNIAQRNGPSVPEEIRTRAGLQPAFAHLRPSTP